MRCHSEKLGVLGPVYELVGQGWNDGAIANKLNLSEVTVHGCISWLSHFLKCDPREALVVYAVPAQKNGVYVRQHEGAIMTTVTDTQPMQTERLDHALEHAVVQSWDELMEPSTSGLIQIEYQTGDDGSLEFLMIWASTIRGHWKLVCELWMRPLWSHATGLRFSNDYHSAAFAHTLELVMGHENAFSKLPDQHGLIQVYPPTQEERREAERWTSAALDHLGCEI